MIPLHTHLIIFFYLFRFGIILTDFLGGKIRSVFVEYMELILIVLYSGPDVAGVYRKKFLVSTLRKPFEVDQIGSFPYNGVYTEKLIFQSHFYAISGVLAEDFSVYTPFQHRNRA